MADVVCLSFYIVFVNVCMIFLKFLGQRQLHNSNITWGLQSICMAERAQPRALYQVDV